MRRVRTVAIYLVSILMGSHLPTGLRTARGRTSGLLPFGRLHQASVEVDEWLAEADDAATAPVSRLMGRRPAAVLASVHADQVLLSISTSGALSAGQQVMPSHF